MLSVSAPVQFSARPPAVKFSSDIYLVSRKDFDALGEKLVPPHMDEQRAEVPWSIFNRVQNQPRGYTDGAYDCNAGGITNGQQVSLFHLLPKSAEPNMVKRELGRDIAELRQNGGNELRGLITGGRAYDSEKTPDSKRLFDTLNTVMKEGDLGDRVTRLWGRKSERAEGPTDVMYDAAHDSWYLHVQRRTELPPTVDDLRQGVKTLISKGLRKGPFFTPKEIVNAFTPPKYQPAALSLADLKDTFEVVQIAPGDHLKTPDDPGYRAHIEKVLSED